VWIASDRSGERLDRTLANCLPDLSRSRLKALIEQGKARLEGGDARAPRTITDPAFRVKPGQAFLIEVPEPVAPTPEAQAIPLSVVHEDADIIVIDKPAGMVVHPAPGNPDRTLVNALIAHCGRSLSGIGGVRRPGIVHRIDKDTSGLLVAAKNDAAHRQLSEAFRNHEMERAYLCVVWGVPVPSKGEIQGNIGRHPTHRKRMAVLRSGGKKALTRYRVLQRFGEALSLVECRLETGRTHQIRVHMASIGHPLVGDRTYGRARRPGSRAGKDVERAALAADFPRQALHAAILGIHHPATQKEMRWESPLPEDLRELVRNVS
jgi:23S rRNA pseudouridine1911/1915/1917 synthase